LSFGSIQAPTPGRSPEPAVTSRDQVDDLLPQNIDPTVLRGL
jgi:hypothetical protein